MPLSAFEFDEICRVVCPSCAKGDVPKQRSNGEWQHVKTNGGKTIIGICWANGLRNSRFAKEAE